MVDNVEILSSVELKEDTRLGLGLVEIVDEKISLSTFEIVADVEYWELVAWTMLTTLMVLVTTGGMSEVILATSELLVVLRVGIEATVTSDVLEGSLDKAVLLRDGVGVGVGKAVLQDCPTAAGRKLIIILRSMIEREGIRKSLSEYIVLSKEKPRVLTLHNCIVKVCIENDRGVVGCA